MKTFAPPPKLVSATLILIFLFNIEPMKAQCPSAGANSLSAALGGKLTEELYSLDIRDELMGDVVSGENDYVKNNVALKIWDEQFAYSILREEPALLNLGSDEDLVYQNYYDSITSTNTGWIQKSIDYLSQNKFDSAALANGNSVASNKIESNRKTVNEILLAHYQMELPVLDSDQVNILTPIGYSDPLTNGEAVYATRVLLGIDPDGSVKYEEATEEFAAGQLPWLKIYPNPASNQLNIVCNTDAAPAMLNIYSITGIFVLQLELVKDQTSLDISDLKEGVYIIRARNGDLPVCYNKLIVSK
jgi:hypothetical protein